MAWSCPLLRTPYQIHLTTMALGSPLRITAEAFKSSTNATTYPPIGPTRSSTLCVTTISLMSRVSRSPQPCDVRQGTRSHVEVELTDRDVPRVAGEGRDVIEIRGAWRGVIAPGHAR